MRDVRWLARVTTEGPAPTTGAGILVTDRWVLTCAHVVAGVERAVVRLVNQAAGRGLGAAVLRRGPWPDGPGGTGDVAVLVLDEPVPAQSAEPARFAPLHGWTGLHTPQLAAYGFPAGHDGGLSSEIRLTRGGFRIGGELVQLEHEGTGMPLAPGFSGGPVVIAGTGEVVGLVTAAQDTLWRGAGDRSRPAVRLGHMLPAEALARYVPELADLLPGAALPRSAVRELRLLLVGATSAADPLELYRAAVGTLGCPDPPQRPATLWEACWYLLAEVPQQSDGRHPVVAFVERVAASPLHAPSAPGDPGGADALGRGLRDWLADHPGRPPAAASVPAVGRWRPILVEIGPSGAGPGMFHVTIAAIRDGVLGEPHSSTVPKPRLAGFVRDRIDREIGLLEPDGTELIIFVLPRKWLTQPVHSWARRRTDFGPLGADHAVVVVDQQRRAAAADRRQLEMKWSVLRGSSGTELHPVPCDDPPDSRRFYQQLRPPERTALPALGGPPKGAPFEQLLAAALKAGAPAVLWAGQPCGAEHARADHAAADHAREGTCRSARFLARLAEELAEVPPADLPCRIKELRHQAEESEDPAGHWADGLVLLWEDPEVLPSPHRPYRVVPTAGRAAAVDQ
ncbi:VMAP-C domain-containing protein [Kitasatospora sp. McL0602]|uniref:VMAP-C domain-containing protein n=1 Tax=Kitasatospora sp. McL0602 TaxID=3439530 RepID=UPI003F8A3871